MHGSHTLHAVVVVHLAHRPKRCGWGESCNVGLLVPGMVDASRADCQAARPTGRLSRMAGFRFGARRLPGSG